MISPKLIESVESIAESLTRIANALEHLNGYGDSVLHKKVSPLVRIAEELEFMSEIMTLPEDERR